MLLPITHFFFNDTATAGIYSLSLHDALPISEFAALPRSVAWVEQQNGACAGIIGIDRIAASPKIGRAHVWNSSHVEISYAVFCLKKKNNYNQYGSYKLRWHLQCMSKVYRQTA